MANTPAAWVVYILRCAGGTLYTGITTDTDRRVAQHNAGTASKYTRARRPVAVAYTEAHPDRSSASKREAAIKALTRAQKEKLITERPGTIVPGPSGAGR